MHTDIHKMRSQTFAYGDETLHYVTVGSPDKPLLLMIHGYTSAHIVWKETIAALQDDFYCVAIDLMGHGDSDIVPHGDYSIRTQGKRVLALADELGYTQFSMIGHSMGGQIALCIASLLAPERVEKVISVSGVVAAELTPFVQRTTFRMIKMGHASPFFWLVEAFGRATSPRFKPAAAFQHAAWFYDMDAMLKRFDDWRQDRIYANQRGIRHTWWHGMHAIEALDLTPHLPKIQVPTLALFGAQDNAVPVRDGQLVADHVPDGAAIFIDDCGHFPMYEQTETYQAAVRDFLCGQQES